MRRGAAIILATLAALPLGDAAARDLYAAPEGGEQAACTSADPCSLGAAQLAVRRATRNQREDVRVHLLDGVYALAVPLTLGPADGGGNGHRVIWQAAEGANPVLDGGVPVTGWTLHDAARNIWRAPISDPPRWRTLFVDGRRAARARGRNGLDGHVVTPTGYRFDGSDGVATFRNVAEVELVRQWEWQISRCPVTEAAAGEVRVAQACFDNSQRVNVGLYVENAYELLDQPGEWYLDRSGAVAGGPAVYYRPRDGETLTDESAVFGATEQLLTITGAPGRPVRDITIRGLAFAHAGWFLDRSLAARVGGYSSLQAGAYLLTRHDLDNESVVPPEQDFGFYNVENFSYLGYVPGAVEVNFARGVEFERNRFEHLGATGLAMVRGIQDARIVGNRFRDISGSAIQLGGVEVEDHHPCGDVPACDSERVTQRNRITDNDIDGAALEWTDTLGIWVGYARDTRIERNRIVNTAYSGISVGFGWGWVDAGGHSGFSHPTIAGDNHIVQNDISRHQQVMADGGAIYTLGMQPGSTISGNYIHDVRRVYVGGIYLDEGTVGYVVSGNAVDDATFFSQTNCGSLSRNYGNRFTMNYSHNGAVYRTCPPGKSRFSERNDDNVYEPPILFFGARPPPEVSAIAAAAGPSAEFRDTAAAR